MNRSLLYKIGFLAAGVGALAVTRNLIARQRQFYWSGKVVLITGGSRGLGLVLARKLGQMGAKVAICARTLHQLFRAEEELLSLGIDAIAIQCDVTDRSSVKALVDSIVGRWQTIDVVINNAGIIQMGPLESLTQDDFQNAIATHLWAPLNVMGEVLPSMRQRKAGRIVNIASIGGKVSIPHLLPYCASKFALVGLSEGVAAEVARDGVLVTTVCPGLMRTGSARNALFKGRHRQEYAWFSLANSLPLVSMSAEYAADRIIEATAAGHSHAILGLPAQLACTLQGLLPGISNQAYALASRVLPTIGGIGRESARGAESTSNLSPSVMTVLTERAAVVNNELD